MNATIAVTSLKIDGHSVPVPEGLSELLANTWNAEKREKDCIQEYDRKVIKRDGKFVTLLTRKKG